MSEKELKEKEQEQKQEEQNKQEVDAKNENTNSDKEGSVEDFGSDLASKGDVENNSDEKSPAKDSNSEDRQGQESTSKDKVVSKRGKRFTRGRRKFARKKKFTRRRKEERKPEFEQKIISLRRVTRVVAGGRRFSFSVAMVLGDKHGRVGVGLGKSNDTAAAIEKAVRNAKANMITVRRTEEGSIPFDVKAKYGASVVEIRPAPGRGLVAGASVRAVLDLAGVTDVTSKIWTRSKNQINIARATIEALKKLEEID